MYNIYLKDDDMLQPNHFPVIALVNEAYNSDPVSFIKNLSKEIGSGYNYTTCSFWSELDEYDQGQINKYEGLLVETENGDEVIVSMKEIIHYLEIATVRYVSASKTDCPELISQLKHIKTTAP
jgi:hypothetical protein